MNRRPEWFGRPILKVAEDDDFKDEIISTNMVSTDNMKSYTNAHHEFCIIYKE